MDAEDMKLMVEHGTWYVPTIIAGDYVMRQAKIPGFYPPQVAAKALAVGPLIQATAGRAYKAHLKIASAPMRACIRTARTLTSLN